MYLWHVIYKNTEIGAYIFWLIIVEDYNMAECTSEMKFKSDSEQNGALNSNAIDLLSPTSDHSDKRSDPVVLERELAHELAASEEATKVLSETTISFEEALERELEFQKRMKIVMLQASTDSGSLCIPSQVRICYLFVTAPLGNKTCKFILL